MKNLEALSHKISLRAGGLSINKVASIPFVPEMVLVSLASYIFKFGLVCGTVGPSICMYMHPAKESTM